ncbi:hypothetical protein EAE96_010234 [Botrytis aclada]|nr:hypothetical protein EAE96_010234 [Botrytis aclada]
MTSSDPRGKEKGKGKGKTPDLSSASVSASSASPAPAPIDSNDTPSRLDEQPTPSLFSRIGASAAGLGRDAFVGGAGVRGEQLRRDAQGLLAAGGNGKGGGSAGGNGDLGYAQMHAGTSGLMDGSSSLSGGNATVLGMRSAGNTGSRGHSIRGAGENGDMNGNAVSGDERARWIQQNENEFSEFLDSVPSLTPASDSGFGDAYSSSSYGMHESISPGSLGKKLADGAPANAVGNQAFEDSWARSYMKTTDRDISVREQESRDGNEVRALLSRIERISFEEEIAGIDEMEMEMERGGMKAYEEEWMGMSAGERERIIRVTRDLFPEEVRRAGGVVHGGIDVGSSLNLKPEYERGAEERWGEERGRERGREEAQDEGEDDDDDDDEFEGAVLNYQDIKWRARKEKKKKKKKKNENENENENRETKKWRRGKAKKEEWKSDWEGVLSGYTDEVWGGLLPLVREAREELEGEEEEGDGRGEGEGKEKEKERGNLKALRRLGAVLGHLRGLDGGEE